jgi:LCP family protein required for cell wall assembly
VAAAALSSLVPGAGQLLRGRWKTAILMLAPVLAVVLAAIGLATRGFTSIAGLSVQPRWLWTLFWVNLGVLAVRLLSVGNAYRPGPGTSAAARRVGAVALIGIMAITAVPHAFVASYALEALDVLTTVFVADEPVAAADTVPVDDTIYRGPIVVDPPPVIGDVRDLLPADEFASAAEGSSRPEPLPSVFGGLAYQPLGDHLTVLLAGGDAGPGRSGLRTDTIIVAVFDLATNRAALFGVPRNLAQVPLPGSIAGAFHGMQDRFWQLELDEILAKQQRKCDRAMRKWEEGKPLPKACTQEPPAQPRRCDCFPDMINALYPNTRDWTNTFPTAIDPGMEALRQALEVMMGIPIDYYVLVDMAGFVALVDALGGVELNVTESIHATFSPAEEGGDPVRVDVDPGWQELDGHAALAYVRSRLGSSDYTRMERQRCMLRAIAAEADPFNLITSFPEIADAIKTSTTTDIPLSIVPDLIWLAGNLDYETITTYAFEPGYYAPTRDWRGAPISDSRRIRAKVQEVLTQLTAGAVEADGEDECAP